MTVGLLASLGACAPSNLIRIAQQATRDSLVFTISGATNSRPMSPIYGLSVVRCADEHPMWTIAADGSRNLPATVRYGALIAGYPTQVGPEPLVPGCYRAFLSNANPLVFDVAGQGTVSPRR